MKKISVVIPVYNAQRELAKAIESVLSQTEKDLELILVDDGSTDGSLSVCRAYEKKDPRVRVLHQQNAGVSAARNAGIAAAEGAFLGFVDSDDWIEPDMYARLLAEAASSRADVVMCDALTEFEDGTSQTDTISRLSAGAVLKKEDFTPSLLLEMAGSACRCLYSRRLFFDFQNENGGIRFPLGVKFSEDRIFNLYAFGFADRVSYLKEPFYHRFMNKKSAVHRFHDDYFEACKLSAHETEKAIDEAWDGREAYQTAYLRQFISGAFSAINNYFYKTSPLSANERKAKLISLCGDDELRSAIRRSGFGGRHSQWILKKNYLALALYAKLANLKHGR